MTNKFIMEDSAEIKFYKTIPANLIKGSIFRHYGIHDPSGLCDGGDYLYNVQIRIENNNGDVYISIQPKERSEWWCGTMKWQEFHDMMLDAIKNNPKIKYNER
jgi:hypothetical protein